MAFINSFTAFIKVLVHYHLLHTTANEALDCSTKTLPLSGNVHCIFHLKKLKISLQKEVLKHLVKAIFGTEKALYMPKWTFYGGLNG